MTLSNAGCQTCKLRRIKCDGAKPTCQRCTKSRRVCLETSAVKQACFSINLENSYASGETKRPRGPRSSLTSMRPQLDLQARALAYYHQYHIQAPNDMPSVSGGLPESVSMWKASGKKSSIVDLALSTMALAVYSRTQHHPPAAAEASLGYYRLLRLAQEYIAQLTIANSDERGIDACLLAVSLMARYEGATHHSGSGSSDSPFALLQNRSHHDGAMAILKLWSDNPDRSTASFIIRQTRRGLIKCSLHRNLRLPDWMMDGSRFGEHGVYLDYDRVMVRVANLRHASISLGKGDLQVLEVEDLNIQAEELERALEAWRSNIPASCSHQRHVITKPNHWPRRHFFSPVVYSYPAPVYAAAWGHYHAMKMFISSTRLRILKMSRPILHFPDVCYEKRRLEYITQLKAVAHDLASSIPFCLERFQVDNPNSITNQASVTLNMDEDVKPYVAGLMVWPLTIAASLEEIDTKQQEWFRSELALLGTITGDGITECAQTGQWAVL